MNAPLERSRESGFGLGLLLGTCVGAGLVLWLAPRMGAEIRQRATDSAKGLAHEVAGAVAQGAHAVERAATAART